MVGDRSVCLWKARVSLTARPQPSLQDQQGAMPNSPSAGKRLRQSIKRRKHNRITKKVIKTSMRKTLQSVSEHNLEKAEADFRAAVAKIDKAGSRRVLHPNTAARRKSKLARAIAAAEAKEGILRPPTPLPEPTSTQEP